MFLEKVFRVVICILLLFIYVLTVVDQFTSVGEERANLSAVVCLWLCGCCLERFPLPLGAWNGLCYFIVALPEPSI